MSASPPAAAAAAPSHAPSPADPHWAAFVDSRGPEIFQPVAFGPDIWRPDPFDVESIHAEARDVFDRLLRRAAEPDPHRPGPKHGRTLLLLGEAGAGKTHLLRAFRHRTHTSGQGYFAYLQLTTNIGNYFQYILRNVVESLGQPYGVQESGAAPPTGAQSGLFRLSDALAEHPAAPSEWVAALREGEFDDYPAYAEKVADTLLDSPALAGAGLDLNVTRALLCLQRREPKITRRVTAYLRGGELTESDRAYLGGIPSRSGENDHLETLTQLARLAAVAGGAFVVCFDQLEYLFENGETAAERFRRAMQAAQMLADANPSSLVVIACLENYYSQFKTALHRSTVDRLELDPPPVRLDGLRTAPEITELVARRLGCLYGWAELPDPPAPVYPFDAARLARSAGTRTRDVLHACHEAREEAIRTGKLPALSGAPQKPGKDPRPGPVAPDPVDPDVALEQLWNDFRAASPLRAPDDDAALAALLAWAVVRVSEELALPAGQLRAQAVHGLVEIDTPAPDGTLLASICDKAAAGGALGKQLTALVNTARAAGRAPAAIRTTEFPGKKGSAVARQLGELLVKENGRKVVIEDPEWLAYALLREFLQRRAGHPALETWRRTDRPLARLAGLRQLLALDAIPPAAAVEPPAMAPAPGIIAPARSAPAPEPPPSPALADAIPLGRTRETASRPVTCQPADLTRHAAFLGGSGSGKTTLALALVEHLLERGIPAVLLDRKGDLCRFADPAAWGADSGDAASDARRARLRGRIDVAVFTPGSSPLGRGRPLAISLLPTGAGQLPTAEREAAARQAASSLCAMMRYRTSGTDAARLAMLGQAIATLAELQPDRELSLDGLIGFIHERDETLVNAIGHFNPRHFDRLVEDLSTFRYANAHLLADHPGGPGGPGERVDADALLGRGPHAVPGRTRLTIISTKFLGDHVNTLFWIAQFLLEMNRYARRHPSPDLQAVVLFDEADLYLPAVGKPATKEGMEDALRRWRSAGLGMLLATQSPGDFDYKCRDQINTWFVGRIRESVAVNKMKPMLADARTDVGARLAGLTAGQFFVLRPDRVESLAAERSLVAPEQLADEEILRLAERTAAKGVSA